VHLDELHTRLGQLRMQVCVVCVGWVINTPFGSVLAFSRCEPLLKHPSLI
jgi:hypothetical protein